MKNLKLQLRRHLRGAPAKKTLKSLELLQALLGSRARELQILDPQNQTFSVQTKR